MFMVMIINVVLEVVFIFRVFLKCDFAYKFLMLNFFSDKECN